MRRALGILVRSLGLEHPNSQKVRGNYIVLLQALKLPKTEVQQRVQAAWRAGRAHGLPRAVGARVWRSLLATSVAQRERRNRRCAGWQT